MSELKNIAESGVRGSVTLGERMREGYVKTQRQARGDGNSQQKSVTEFAEDEAEEKARIFAAAAGQTATLAGRTAVRSAPQNVDELKRQAAVTKAKIDKAKKSLAAKKNNSAAVKQSAPQSAGTNVNSNSPPPSSTAGTSGLSQNIQRNGANPTYRQKSAGKAAASYSATKTTGAATAKTAGKTVSFSSARAAGTTTTATVNAANAAKNAYKRQKQTKSLMSRSRQTLRATVEAVKVTVKSTKALVALLIAGGWISVVIILIVVMFGCAITMFGGGSNSNSYTPVSTEVRGYQAVIEQYAAQHGVPEYVDLIMAVMMQESGGQGTDPMQASECSYNSKYPKTPNGISDPEYSINVGIKNLASCLKAANVGSPIDMERIKLALQGYNYGNGYIAWADEHYKGYSTANAIEFSDLMARKKGWSSYGDSNYVLHVLKYYPIGRAFTAGGNQVIIDIAASQIGNKGGRPYWSWYGFNSRVAWCACFVSWCADQCGYIDAGIIPKFSLCSDGVAWFKERGQWQDRNYVPQAGDLIFFDWEKDGHTDHVAIVEKCEDGVVYTIEGNSGDACKRQHYSVGSGNIFGYGCPLY